MGWLFGPARDGDSQADLSRERCAFPGDIDVLASGDRALPFRAHVVRVSIQSRNAVNDFELELFERLSVLELGVVPHPEHTILKGVVINLRVGRSFQVSEFLVPPLHPLLPTNYIGVVLLPNFSEASSIGALLEYLHFIGGGAFNTARARSSGERPKQ
jgi:hypothetical protein